MTSIFDDILERAEKLHTDANLGDLSAFPTIAHASSNNTNVENTMLDTEMADIFQQSEEMWTRKRLTKEASSNIAISQPSTLSSLKANKDISQLNITTLQSAARKALSKETHVSKLSFEETGLLANTSSGAYDALSNKEIERYVENSFERARVELERTFLNQQILERARISPLNTTKTRLTTPRPGENDPFNPTNKPFVLGSVINNEPLEYQQNLFAKKIDSALKKNCNTSIREALLDAVNEINEKEVNEIWRKVFVICSKSFLEDSFENVREMRSSKKWVEHVVRDSIDFLHEHFKEYVDTLIENNLLKAKRGGQVGTVYLVEAFLNIKQFTNYSAEDGYYDKHPKWSVLFYCLRLGDYNAVVQVSEKLRNVPHCLKLLSILTNLNKNPYVSPENKAHLSAEWRQVAARCRDPFKKAVYGAFLGFDCPEVNSTIEDWLWSRLLFCKFHQNDILISFRQLQRIVCVEFGEEYFLHQASNCLVYFTVLILTGQIEQAISILYRDNLLVHAVHIAILAYQLKLLMLPSKITSDILSVDVHDATICQINLIRLVLLYVKNFELKNVKYALNYCFFLNKLELKDIADFKDGRNAFKSCVSRIVYLSQETDLILGRLNSRGERQCGLIDRFSNTFNPSEIINYVAADTYSSGDALQACLLYTLADNPNEAIKIICRQLSMQMINNDTDLAKTLELAQWLAKKYSGNENKSLEQHNLTTLFLLIDLQTFIRCVNNAEYEVGFQVMQKLKLIPLDPEEVQSFVRAFDMVPDEARTLLPDICIALMKSIVILYENEPKDSQTRQTLKNSAEAIILYSAMIPYRFPVSCNSLLLQLQSKII